VAAAESEPPEEAAAVMQRHTEAGAARERRASLDRRRLPQLPPEPNPALVRYGVTDGIIAFAGSMRFVY
jgi:hypothetical protein